MVAIAGGGGMAHAQDVSTAVIAGRVTSQAGAPLAGVRVSLASPVLLGARQIATDSNGQFRIPLLTPGQYTITYTLNDYITRRVTMQILAGQVSNANATLAPMGTQEVVVEILGNQAQIDKTDTVVQTTLSAEKLAPIMNNARWDTMAFMIPSLFVLGGNQSETMGGVTQYNAMMQGQTVIRGGTMRSTKTYVNGMNTTNLYEGISNVDAFLPLEDLVESTSVMLSPLNSKHGNSDGGIISIVTSRGSNDFKGSLRATLENPAWSARDEFGRPARDGIVSRNSAPNSELTKKYEFTLKGPLWKDKVTFAYGGVLTPTQYQTANRWWNWSNPNPQPGNAVGTYFQDPTTGDIIRRAELRSVTYPNSATSQITTTVSEMRNQFTVYAQITPQHQLEYMYSEQESTVTNPGAGPNQGTYLNNHIDMDPDNVTWRYLTQWNLAYKGIIGNSGVLEVSYGKKANQNAQGYVGDERPAIYNTVMSSYVPIDGNYANGNPSNYNSNGFVDTWGATNASFGGYNWNNSGTDQAMKGGTDTWSVNYQHMLNSSMGSHIIDVGMSHEKAFRVPNASNGFVAGPLMFWTAGQIAEDLGTRPYDVYNPGTGSFSNANASRYKGKFIVYNVTTATLRDIDPIGVARWEGQTAWGTVNPDIPILQSGGSGRVGTLPYMRQRFGRESGEFNGSNQSFYVNDLWSINNHHSVMLGLRFDQFTLGDAVTSDLHSYSKPTFRSEYKWDILGDNSRLLSVSLAQFHTFQNLTLFQPTIDTLRLNSYREVYWTGPGGTGSSKPYLVDYTDIINPANYDKNVPGALRIESIGGATSARIDPDMKAPTSTEFSVGFARNLKRGGSWKITFVRRTWEDLYDIFPGEPVLPTAENGLTSAQLMKVLKNTDVFEKTYTAVEIEWNLPITKRFTFGGNYTYVRFMHNMTNMASGNDDVRDIAGWNDRVNWTEHWDNFWPREVWNPAYNRLPDHTAGLYLIYDLSSAAAKSSIAIRSQYVSGQQTYDSWGRTVGYSPRMQDFGIMDNNPASPPAGFNSAGRNIPYLWRYTDDNWGMTLRYHFEMPLISKLTWFVTADISNPFNHRAKNPWGPAGSPGGLPGIFDVDQYRNGTLLNPIRDPYAESPWNGKWWSNSLQRTSYGNSFWSPRTLATVQSGLRF
jgi:hypothetical protein